MGGRNVLIQLRLLCKKCRKPISTIFKPCPHCGYQHPLSEAGKRYAEELKKKEAKE